MNVEDISELLAHRIRKRVLESFTEISGENFSLSAATEEADSVTEDIMALIAKAQS